MQPANRPMPLAGKVLFRTGWPLIRAVGRVGFDLRVDRLAPLPPAPFVLAANHFSHLDPVVIAAAVPRPIRYLAVDELYGLSRPLDLALSIFAAVPLTRTRIPLAALRIALARLAFGEIVGVFPEGRRVSRWGEVVPRPGAAWLALRAGVPLVPVAVAGTNRAMGLDNRIRRAPIRVTVGPALSPKGGDASGLIAAWATWVEGHLDMVRA